ncbi:MAG: S8 family serine peptidase [Isosphaeraceae bacterium]
MRPSCICIIGLLATGLSARGQQVSPAVAARLADGERVRQRLGLSPEFDGTNVANLKIAVLDYGFDGVGGPRRYLPENAVLVENYDADFVRKFDLGDPAYTKEFEAGNRHGRDMAQIVWAVTGGKAAGPKFYLLNASGPTMLRRAVCYAIVERVDIILFSGVFEGGGSGDGQGPINRIVDEALAAGILWINAAGNHGQHVYEGPIRVLRDGYLRLRDKPDIAALRFLNRVDENSCTITLTWNDYRDTEDAGTDKDLDLFVEDWTGRPVGSATKRQVSGEAPTGEDETRNPRERLVLASLPACPDVPNDPNIAYRIRVKAKSGKFMPGDRLRVLVTASQETYMAAGGAGPRQAFEFLDASDRGEIYPPADHPLVLTAGDATVVSSVGPTIDGRPKPDVLIEDSRAFYSDGRVTAGSSNAAAYFAGIVAVLKAAEPNLRASHLLALAKQINAARPAADDRPRQPWPPSDAASPLTRGRPTSTQPISSLIEQRLRTPPRPQPPAPSPIMARMERSARAWQTPSRERLSQLIRDGR